MDGGRHDHRNMQSAGRRPFLNRSISRYVQGAAELIYEAPSLIARTCYNERRLVVARQLRYHRILRTSWSARSRMTL